MIRIKIHRGTHQIGGCATEIECDGERVLIDLGANLREVMRRLRSPIPNC